VGRPNGDAFGWLDELAAVGDAGAAPFGDAAVLFAPACEGETGN